MSAAYLDTSVLLGIAFGESGARQLAARMDSFDTLVSANLLEAEFRAALKREGVVAEEGLLHRVAWIIPDRPLHEEISRVLATGPVRGADCWHLASALFLAGEASGLTFLSLDRQQAKVARALGFRA